MVLGACALLSAFPLGAAAEQTSEPALAAAGQLDAGAYHSCAVLSGGRVRCWGFNGDGQLGYANTSTVGDDETPGSLGPVNLGAGRSATAVSAGDFHSCAVVDGGVRCWGFGLEGRLGYGNTSNVGESQDSGSVGPVDFGGGRSATAVSAGGAHTCAVLNDASVRCWGFGATGQLGYSSESNVGDSPATAVEKAGAVDLGSQRTAKALSAGGRHTCAILDDGTVRCWGYGGNGRLGYAKTEDVGDDETPGSVNVVDLGAMRTATAISAGGSHTCAVLDDGTVRCWGFGFSGQLGYGNQDNIGDNETPGSVGPIDFGPDRKAVAISAGGSHTCAILEDGTVRCWGYGADGRLGYASTANIGDDEPASSVGPVDLGRGRTAVAISAGGAHTCARLDDGSVRCWGAGANGRLGYCNPNSIGDDEPPSSVGPVSLEPGDGGTGCAGAPGVAAATAPATGVTKVAVVDSDAARARGLRACLAGVASHATREQRLARRGSARQRAKAKRHLNAHARSGRRHCLRRYARTPGPITGLRARARGKTQVELSFSAPGTDGNQAPAARSYVVKQSRRPIRGVRGFARAKTLCKGACRFTVAAVGGKVTLAVTDLRPHTTYYYAIAARDNVSARRGPTSRTLRAKTA